MQANHLLLILQDDGGNAEKQSKDLFLLNLSFLIEQALRKFSETAKGWENFIRNMPSNYTLCTEQKGHFSKL